VRNRWRAASVALRPMEGGLDVVIAQLEVDPGSVPVFLGCSPIRCSLAG